MSRFLITGGAGFIGSSLCHALAPRHDVCAVDNLLEGKRSNLAGCKARFVRGDIRDPPLMARLSRGADFILHQAAMRSVPQSVKFPRETAEVNIIGTINVLEAARRADVCCVVFASSSSIYGAARPPHAEPAAAPLSPYAASKLAGEHYCRVYYELYGLRTVSLRYFNVYGPRQDPASEYATVVPRFIHALFGNQRPVIYGDGQQSRSFAYVEDIVRGNILACSSRRAAGEVVNIAGSHSYSVLHLLRTLERITGKKANPRFEPPRAGDVRRTQAHLGKAKRILGYEPRVGFEEGLRRTVRWFGQA